MLSYMEGLAARCSVNEDRDNGYTLGYRPFLHILLMALSLHSTCDIKWRIVLGESSAEHLSSIVRFIYKHSNIKQPTS